MERATMMPNGNDHFQIDDTLLVERAQRGDDTAFAELVSRHRLNAEKLALSILRNREDAEDEVQNAIWKAYQHIDRFQQEARFSTWLTRIVVNQCLMRIRKAKRARLLHVDDVRIGEEIGTMDLPDKRQTPEASVGAVEVSQVLHGEIRRVPPLLRNVFVLREVERLPMPEVAARLGISVAAAKSRLLRARKELRSRLEVHIGRAGLATLLAKA
jgi:RNA polymerase sigma-70 factor (ECF subfamily)